MGVALASLLEEGSLFLHQERASRLRQTNLGAIWNALVTIISLFLSPLETWIGGEGGGKGPQCPADASNLVRGLDDSTHVEEGFMYLIVLLTCTQSNKSKFLTHWIFAISSRLHVASKLPLSYFNSSLEWKELRQHQKRWQRQQARGKSCENGREQREEGRKAAECLPLAPHLRQNLIWLAHIQIQKL